MNILDSIHSPEDLKHLNPQLDAQLCEEIRQFLVGSVSKTGGHLASNLGVVELTLAIHKVFDTSRDRLVFDVGHQSYVHKLLTGRKEGFAHLRAYGGMSGFPKPHESVHDAFIAGHASNAVSVALGFARARTAAGQDHSVIALMGDGALTGGLAYEGLNDAGQSGEPLIVILNDNGMSISKNVGAISEHLAHLRLKSGYFGIKRAYRKFTSVVPGGKYLYAFTHKLKQKMKQMLLGSTMFEEMGFAYLGPVDGHDLSKLTYLLQEAKQMGCPVLIHAITKKGKGDAEAEAHPDRFHGIGVPGEQSGVSFSKAFGAALTQLAERDSRICAVTAAMPAGTGLSEFASKLPNRLFDVGIAEEHAVAMASGLAAGGMIPVVAIYSTFLQRAFDMLIHDTALMQNHVVFAVDRAGLVGEDGATHHGVFDVGYLRQVPGMTVLCPATTEELKTMLHEAIYDYSGPVAVRYPRGIGFGDTYAPERSEKPDLTIVSYGTLAFQANECAQLLAERGIRADVVRLRIIAPLDLTEVAVSCRKSGRLLVAEESAQNGCVGESIAAALQRSNPEVKVVLKNLGSSFVPHGANQLLFKQYGIDAEGLCRAALEAFSFEGTN
ncbi:MAG: 1-deoxy-D-xylulose-5-phosphate synthase [Ruminococcaceae bacterium]|nr:1-deoxy-D-xylulose-5-phosphate synthase [Oscillospiraceae bacterium]